MGGSGSSPATEDGGGRRAGGGRSPTPVERTRKTLRCARTPKNWRTWHRLGATSTAASATHSARREVEIVVLPAERWMSRVHRAIGLICTQSAHTGVATTSAAAACRGLQGATQHPISFTTRFPVGPCRMDPDPLRTSTPALSRRMPLYCSEKTKRRSSRHCFFIPITRVLRRPHGSRPRTCRPHTSRPHTSRPHTSH